MIDSASPYPLLLGTLAEFERHVQHTAPEQDAFRSPGAMADRAEGRFDRIAASDALPVLCRDGTESHPLLPVFVQALHSLRALQYIRQIRV